MRLRISEVFQEAHYAIQREYSKENCNDNILFWSGLHEAWKRALDKIYVQGVYVYKVV